MNQISDITLLIAVIALALWPIILFVLRLISERKKRLTHLERMTKNELRQLSTQELVLRTLKTIGCQPEINPEGHIAFKYQGDDFYIAAEDESRFIMIWNPWWGSINNDNEAFPYLKEVINLVNISSLVTTIFMTDEDEKTIGLHSHCHTYFTPNEEAQDEHLKMLLDMFFEVHCSITDGLNQLGAASIEEEQKKERVKIKGFAAYKENTMPIETKCEEA